MRKTKGLTQVAENDSDSDSDSENELDLQVKSIRIREKNKNRTRWIFSGLFIICVACFITICTFLLFYNNSNHSQDQNISKNDAFLTMNNLMELNTDYNNFTDENKSQFIIAFNAFDDDNDGYLNRSEFTTYFELQLLETNSFQRMDTNKDGILSFKECIVYIRAINQIAEINQALIKTVSDEINIIYGFNYESNQNDTELFLEYITMFMYFDEFDLESNGYIKYDTYLSISSLNQFNATDIDKDQQISLNELADMIYSEWNNKLQHLFGDKYEDIMLLLEQIEITDEIVSNVDIEICPFKLNRIQKRYYCNCHKEYICHKIGYCYYIYYGDIKHTYYPPIEHQHKDSIYPDDILTDDQQTRLIDAEMICNDKQCCRSDDYTEYSNTQCSAYGYLECLSSSNVCVWDCSSRHLNNETDVFTLHYNRIFTGIDIHNAYYTNHPQTMDNEEDQTANEININPSLSVVDSCGTTYQYDLTQTFEHWTSQNADSADSEFNGHRRLSKYAKGSEMTEEMRRRLGIMGDDNRTDVTKWEDPYYKNVLIIFETSNGIGTCSGALISKKHVLTAGHCVSDGYGNYYWNFWVYPSYNAGNDGSIYFKYEEAVAFTSWHYNRDFNYDIGVITLDVNDTEYGYFSFGFDDTIDETVLFRIMGYPSDKFYILQKQYMKFDYGIEHNLLKTETGDIVQGNSGGPGVRNSNGVINGVVSHETYQQRWWYIIYIYNALARITEEKYVAICSYIHSFGSTTDRCTVITPPETTDSPLETTITPPETTSTP